VRSHHENLSAIREEICIYFVVSLGYIGIFWEIDFNLDMNNECKTYKKLFVCNCYFIEYTVYTLHTLYVNHLVYLINDIYVYILVK